MTKIEQFKKRFERTTKRLHNASDKFDRACEAYESLQEQAKAAGIWEELCAEMGWTEDHTANDACA